MFNANGNIPAGEVTNYFNTETKVGDDRFIIHFNQVCFQKGLLEEERM